VVTYCLRKKPTIIVHYGEEKRTSEWNLHGRVTHVTCRNKRNNKIANKGIRR